MYVTQLGLKRVSWMVILLILPLLSACGLPFSPEQAAVRAVVEGQTQPQPNPATVKVLQTQAWQDNVIVLVTFQAIEDSGQISECLFLYETRPAPLGWVPGSGGGGCGLVGESGESIGIGAGQYSGTGRVALSHVNGLVYDNQIETVEVIWDDSEEQQVGVINSSYLALRAGSHEYVEIRALDAKGELLYTFKHPELAPGKESHHLRSTTPQERNSA